ncbi:polyketide synthase [Bradyrhizobium sp. SSBR45G]|uniref:type I polyketide synthase n=1 Tax=unclassified Bradyrhizobium TaxID=2631580 RepID=UPI002342A314|nr:MULTISPECIES: type I polyketide synthase [unclassified Bradyrhizobium]GLH76254.1 polyketide synthase [Bradyrhizobium sp. SSBR45G]GLH83263.1 polyketide synthase [Bradyrhizobium sp. SSBR45R]
MTGSGSTEREAVAVIGMAGRFPGAPDVETFWRNLKAGIESVRALSDDDLAKAGVPTSLSARPDYVRAKAVLDDADCFDHDFFGYAPREAILMDPQHRLLLEVGHAALESAGYRKGGIAGWTGIFAGAARAGYWLSNLTDNPRAAEGDDQIFIGNEKDFLATRLAFKLDLHGPAVDVQTGCSTSLVAVHMACRALLAFECDVALAGGVTVSLPLTGGYLHQEGSVLARDGHCRPFDAAGDGIVPGNAAAMVVLKRLSEALADGDIIHAVIRGSAINNDGGRKMSFTAPSVEGQAEAVLLAQQLAGITADQIGLIEAHGTGTRLGDPIEVSALTQAFRETTERNGFCALGSLKGNVGHLDAAAGVAGLIKAVCAVRDGIIPPTINVNTPNPAINFAGSPFYLATESRTWSDRVRRAGVSAFGIGGTNAHVVVESFSPPRHAGQDGNWRVLPFSARDEDGLERLRGSLASHLAGGQVTLADAAYTFQVGRTAHEQRCAIIARDATEAAQALSGASGRLVATRALVRPKRAFLFPGGGVAYPGMARGLLEQEPAFRDALLEMAAHLGAAGVDVLRLIRDASETPADRAARITLPATFAVSYALARLWQARGVTADIMLGHSLGEYAAATLSGVFTLADAARIVALRSALQDANASGVMLAVMASRDATMALADPGVDLAAINGPDLCTVSGPAIAIDQLERRLDAQGIRSQRLALNVGGHSRAIDAVMPVFRAGFAGVSPRAPSCPIISSLTGDWLGPGDFTPDYWVTHLRHTVRFDRALATLLREPDLVLVECGPGEACTMLAAQHPAYGATHHRVTSLRKASVADDDKAVLLTAAAQLWCAGVDVDLSATAGVADGVRVPLPTYPFTRNRLWIDAPAPGERRIAAIDKPIEDWFYLPAWRRALAQVARSAAASGAALVFDDGSAIADGVIAGLHEAGHHPVLRVRAGDGFAIDEQDVFEIRPGSVEDFGLLLIAAGVAPATVVHLWNAGTDHGTEAEVCRGFMSVVALMQGCATAGCTPPARIVIGTRRALAVDPTDEVIAARTTVLGVAQVLPQEFPGCEAGVVDLDRSASLQATVEGLMREIEASRLEPVVGLRGRRRWLKDYTPVQLGADKAPIRSVASGDLVVITGGLGRIGRLLAGHLVRQLGARVALIVRPGFPDESRWNAADSQHAERIAALRQWRSERLPIEIIAADVTDPAAMSQAIAALERQHGPVAGLIHAAAVTSGTALISPILQLSPEDAAAQFAPKLAGLDGLDAAVAACAKPPRFVVLLSSNAAILGGLGFAAYSAANHVLDAAAALRSRQGVTDWISTNWDRWLTRDDELAAGSGTSMDAFAMRPAESLATIMRIILQGDAEQFVVTRGDLAQRRQVWIAREDGTETISALQPRASQRRTAYRAPDGEIETGLATLWSQLLGIDRIGADDNFFDLGGHSLRAVQLLARVTDQFGVRLSLKTFFAAPTVAGLALSIGQALTVTTDQATLTALLDGLDQLAGKSVPEALAS